MAEKAPKSQTHIRVTFHLPRFLMADLQSLVGRLRAEATTTGAKAPTMSGIIEAALRAELKRRR